ncbi:unnamed protein product [Prunus brigantina]
MEFLDKLSTKTPVVCTIDRSLTWMDPILQFLQYQQLHTDPTEARHVHYRSARYLIINEALYNQRERARSNTRWSPSTIS